MIFISGVHGVGKSYFCNKVKEELGINTFSASKLISEHKHAEFSRDKLIPDIDHNQQYLLMAIRDLNAVGSDYLLDGSSVGFYENRLWWPYWRSTFWAILAKGRSMSAGEHTITVDGGVAGAVIWLSSLLIVF